MINSVYNAVIKRLNPKNLRNNLSKNALLYLAAAFFFYAANGAFGMLQGIYIKELNIGEDFLGLIISLRTIAMAAFSVPCAMFVNKFGKRKGILLSMFLIPLLVAAQGYSQDRWIILVLAILQGGANSFLMVSEGPFFMENSTEKNRLTLFSYAFADNVFSSMIGYYAFGNLSTGLSSSFTLVTALRYTIMLAGLFGIIACLFAMRIKDVKTVSTAVSKENGTRKAFYKDMIGVLRKKSALNFLVYNSMIGFGAGLVVPYFNVYLKYKINIDTAQIGVVMSLAQGAMGLGGLITPTLAKRYGRINTIIACQVASIPFLMLIALPPSVLIVSIALFMRNALMNMAGPIIGNMSMEMVGANERSIFSSVSNIAGNLSRGLSAVVAGFIMNNFTNGYEIPYFITAILYVIGTVYFYKCFKNYNKKSGVTAQ